MSDLMTALRGANHEPAAPGPAESTGLPLQRLEPLLLVGGGHTVGAAVMAEALVDGRFARVLVLAEQRVASTVRGFVALPPSVLAARAAGQDADPVADPLAELAVVVFERPLASHGRDEAFVQPVPGSLLPLARQLHAAGVRRLIVVVPHAPALLPQALSHGFESLDEAAVAGLGFTHLLFLRASQAGERATGGSPVARFARWWLSQLNWMVPQRQQPLRASRLARCVVALARVLPLVPAGTRVISPEQLWLWSQNDARLEYTVAQGLGMPPAA